MIASEKKKILFITHNFPPDFSSGILRTTSFIKNLYNLGWQAHVLTSKRFMESIPEGKIQGIPDSTVIERINYFDSEKDLSVKGKGLSFLAYPDKYMTWAVLSFCKVLLNIKKYDFNIIFSTYPAASAHLIGYALSRILRKPWVADFRDPMFQEDYPKGVLKRKIWKWLEGRIVINASCLIFTTDSAMQTYLKRYPELKYNKCHVIPNGYNDDDFIDTGNFEKTDNAIKIIHAGGLYAEGRNPLNLFKALKNLIDTSCPVAGNIRIEFYGSGNDHLVKTLEDEVDKLHLKNNILFFPAIPHKDMIRKLGQADVLLVLQGRCFDKQIPGKIYEYFRLKKTILALATLEGETGQLIESTKSGFVTDQEDETDVLNTLNKMISMRNQKKDLPIISGSKLKEYSRKEHAKKLSKIFSALLGENCSKK